MNSIYDWSLVASENDEADSEINWRELQDPDTVNNSSRAMMKRIAEWRSDLGQLPRSTGQADQYQVEIKSQLTAYPDGLLVTFLPHQDNVSSCTLKVNTLANKPLRAKSGQNLTLRSVQANVPVMARYYAAADEFLIMNSGYFASDLLPDLISNYVLNSLIPVGSVLPYPVQTIPAGWLHCNGQSLRKEDYPELFARIGYAYGGSGEDFNVPDYRGEFLRGWDNGAGRDPDAATRQNRGDLTNGDNVGTRQLSAVQEHDHQATTTGTTDVQGSHTHDLSRTQTAVSPSASTPVWQIGSGITETTAAAGQHSHALNATTTVAKAGGAETRSRNVGVMFIIFAKPAAALAEMQGLTGLPYTFDSRTDGNNPGEGRIAWDNADPAQATKLYLSETGPNKEAFKPILETWGRFGSTVKGYVYLTKVGQPTTFVYLAINSALVDLGEYVDFDITPVQFGGKFENDDNVNVIFTSVGSGEKGDKGEPGISGGLDYRFQTSTDTTVDPGDGNIRLSAAPGISVANASISFTGRNAAVFADLIKTWDGSTTPTNRGNLILRSFASPQNYIALRITGDIANNNTWGKFDALFIGSSGTLSDNEEIIIEFARTGDRGSGGAGTGDLLSTNNLSDVQSVPLSRRNLGLEIGVNVQPFSANLASWAGLLPSSKENAQQFATQAEMEAGTETGLRSMSPLRVAQAVKAIAPDPVVATALERNYVINPGMRISQQLGVNSTTQSGAYVADQWQHVHSQNGTLTAQWVADPTPGGSPNRFRVTVTAPDTSIGTAQYMTFRQKLEAIQVADFNFGRATARDMVVRFGFKGPAGTYCAAIQNAQTTRTYIIEFTATGADQVVEFAVPGSTDGEWPNDNMHAMTLIVTLAAGTLYQSAPNAWQVGNFYGTPSISNGIGIQSAEFDLFDVGIYLDPNKTKKAPAFSLPDITADRVLCQRYYENGTYFWIGRVTSGANHGTVCEFKVDKRNTPVITQTPIADFGNVSGTPAQASVRLSSYTSVREGTGDGTGQWEESYVANARM